MKRLVTVAVTLAFVVLGPVATALADGPAIVTFSGAISETNRDPVNERTHGLFAHHGIAFDKGYQLSREDLSALPQTNYEDDIPRAEGTYSGPLLTDLLDRVGASGNHLVITGLDGFGAEFDLTVVDQHQPIIAIAVDGEPLSVGELGPAKLVFPKTGDAELDKELRSKGVWALFHVAVVED
ncbi:molybdopterin-dependent oxidoreductase [Hoeflea sp.]|uniref:molybdopterin-dependent oxidoreductase n=1 Tax=Hoeflea sp. TaxID=1940281 RepID=UPI003B0159DB